MSGHRAVLGLVLALPLAATAALGMPSCSSSSSGAVALAQGCSINSDCDTPLICVFTRCHAACRSAVDCPSDERCVPSGTASGDAASGDNVCQLAVDSTCTAATACNGGEVCGADFNCRAPCQTSADCLTGQTCLAIGAPSACYDPHNATDQTAIEKAAMAGDSAAPDAATTDASTEASTDALATAAPDGSGAAPCALGFVTSNFDFGCADSGPPVVLDAGDGGFADAEIAQNCTNCLPSPPQTIMMKDGTPADLYTVNSLVIDETAALRFTGPRPVILAALTTINVLGQILVNGQTNTSCGPGGFASGTSPGPGAGQAETQYPNSGSGGGSYCGTGGSGGLSLAPDAGGVAASGGATYGNATLSPLIGGSSGGFYMGEPSNGGCGGGAIQIVAGTSITIGTYGAINAGGGGGIDGSAAGSGGAILIEAPSVAVNGQVVANGGGGGAGTGNGADGTATGQAAMGYNNSTGAGGGIGGNGSAGTSVNGASGVGGTTVAYDGAGGGGAGRIRINTSSGAATVGSTAVISPALSPATSCATQGSLN
jgi:hypothetical protein